MKISTTRFGPVSVDAQDVIRFPEGLPGLPGCRDWVLLADEQNDAVAWLQSVNRWDVALAVVSPRRFVPDYQVRVARRELEPLKLEDATAVEVLVIAGRTQRSVTLNLKAPLVINVDRRLGRQVIANGSLPLRYELNEGTPALRRIA